MGELRHLPQHQGAPDTAETEVKAPVTSLARYKAEKNSNRTDTERTTVQITSTPALSTPERVLRPQTRRQHLIRSFLYSTGRTTLLAPYYAPGNHKISEYRERIDRRNQQLNEMPAYKVRRVGAGAASVLLTATMVAGIAQLAGSNEAEPAITPATTTTAPPVICEFSTDNKDFIPKPGQGWAVAVSQTEGAMQDAACYSQELNMLIEKYGANPQENLNLTPYPNGYPIPAEVHRVTTTTSTVPGTVTPQS